MMARENLLFAVFFGGGAERGNNGFSKKRILARRLLSGGSHPRRFGIAGRGHITIRLTLTIMTSRYLMKVRALAAAAIAIAAFPMATPANAQDTAAPPPTEVSAATPDPTPASAAATIEVVEVAATEEAPAEGTYEAFMASSDAAMFTVNNLWILISAALEIGRAHV